MKTSAIVLISFFLFAFATNPLPVAAKAAHYPVRDITGENLLQGVDYYILPVVRGRGGGLTLGSTKNGSCPLDVFQEQDELQNGLPLTFSPVNQKKGVIRVSTDLNIKFSAVTICVGSTVWKLKGHDESTGQWFVTTGGVEGNPGRETTSNWFKIERYEDDYKLVFCTSSCPHSCKVLCRDVGIFISEGNRRLALSDVPFKIMFKKP